jgi:hypothetical protein
MRLINKRGKKLCLKMIPSKPIKFYETVTNIITFRSFSMALKMVSSDTKKLKLN